MKKLNIFFLTIIFALAMFSFDFSSVEAVSIQDYEKKIKELEKEQSELKDKQENVKKNKASVNGDMDENKKEQKSVERQMNDIESKLTQTETDIQETENAIAITDNEIKQLEEEIKILKAEIKELEERIRKREQLLKDRLRAIQENGGSVPYMSVILGSQSFGELISRSSAVNSIMDQDKSIMEEHFADKQALQEKETEVKGKKESVEEKKTEQVQQKESLVGLKSQLDDQKAEKEKIKEELEEEFADLEEHSISLQDEQELIASQAAVIEQAKQLAESKKSEIEEEQKRKAAAAAADNGTTESVSGNSNSVNTVVSNGKLAWPLAVKGRLSSSFGPRVHPISGEVGKMHNGQDIAAPGGTPVYSADGGVVAYAGWMNGYGNTIMISHGSLTTLYAHLSSINVSVGQSVSRSQQIGGVGSTGGSTGNHLHFEVHPGGYKNPVNPMGYL